MYVVVIAKKYSSSELVQKWSIYIYIFLEMRRFL